MKTKFHYSVGQTINVQVSKTINVTAKILDVDVKPWGVYYEVAFYNGICARICHSNKLSRG